MPKQYTSTYPGLSPAGYKRCCCSGIRGPPASLHSARLVSRSESHKTAFRTALPVSLDMSIYCFSFLVVWALSLVSVSPTPTPDHVARSHHDAVLTAAAAKQILRRQGSGP